MLKENLIENENVKPNTKEMENLKLNFPQFFDKDGEFLLDRFKDMLKQNKVKFNKEGYELNFLGKSYAKYLSSTKTETFISPHVEENEKEENKESENLYIIGDNIDALKHLLGTYSGKVKMIYIDPPYNTGSDGFVYPDNFQYDPIKLSEMLGIDEEEAERIINLKGKSSHSAWLTFMYPRLVLARELLKEDGVIFISIDDNEQSNLKLMCDEVFGEDNFVVDLIWKKKGGSSNTEKIIGCLTEHILCYARNKKPGIFNYRKIERKYKHRDEIGEYNLESIEKTNLGIYERPSMIYSINDPITGKEYFPSSNKRWTIGEKQIRLLIDDNKIFFDEKKKKVFLIKRPEDYEKSENLYYNLLLDYSSLSIAKDELSIFFGKENREIFDTPKPIELVKHITNIASNDNDIILDFFSGSATTAHSVMQLNAEDGGNRKYILVQLPELIKEDKVAYKEGYKTIDEIGRERIRRASKKIKEETQAKIDYGFKTFSILEPTNEVLTKLEEFEDNPKLLIEDMVKIYDTKYSSGKESILTTYLVLDGYGFVRSEKYILDKYICDKVDKSIYIIEQGLESKDVSELIKRIENLELDINRIVVYSNSIVFNVMHELKKNISNLRNNKYVELVERY